MEERPAPTREEFEALKRRVNELESRLRVRGPRRRVVERFDGDQVRRVFE